MKLTAHRLLGLDFPNRKEWKKLLIDYHQQPLLDLQGYPGMGRKRWAQRNLTRIIDDQTERLLALTCILYNRSQSRVINTDNVEPLMWLIHGRILRMDKKNGMIDFADQTVMDWVKEQPWKQQVHHFLATEQSNPWRILAVPFYVALLMLSVLLLISGSEVGTMLITLLSLVMAGGIPFIGHFLGRFIKG